MKIGIDLHFFESQRGGVARIFTQMLQMWPNMNERHRYVFYFRNYIPEDDFLRHPFFECKVVRGPKFLKKRGLITQQIFMPFDIKEDKLDIFLATDYAAPLYLPCPKSVVCAWDISFSTHKSHYSLAERFRYSFFSRISCRQADGVITASAYDKRQIEKHYNIPSDKICVVELAADSKFKPLEDLSVINSLRAKYNLPKKYIFYMGVICNRRNLDVIINAFKDVYNNHSDVGLLVAGRNQTLPFVDIEAMMKPLIEEGRGCYLTWVPEEELVSLYNGAWYYISASTVEGDNIMLKEAMRCGTPVITSPIMEEALGGNAIIITDPKDRKETAHILDRVIASNELRKEYSDRALKFANSLSWEKMAGDILEYIENL